MNTNFKKERHSVSSLKIHLVFVTKYRKKLLTLESLEVIEKSFMEVAKKMGFDIIEFNGEADHIHLLIDYKLTFPG